MAARTIPLLDARRVSELIVPHALPDLRDGRLLDMAGRPLQDLRISVTDRCNFRCSYCMPKAVFGRHHAFLPHDELLSFEEITRLARQFIALGVRKIRLTGGEPLLRRGIETLVGMLAALDTPDGRPLDLTLTTNGSVLARRARALKAAGLQRVTVSLDALDDAVFRRMNDVDFPVADVLNGIDAARDAGLAPLKVNMVVKRGTNDHEILPMARHFRQHRPDVVLRFIEYMDVGATNGWRLDEVLPSSEVIARINAEMPLRALQASAPGETAERWQYVDGDGEIGVISSVTQAFCSDCTRARLSTDGRLFLCLFGTRGHDLRALLRGGADDEMLRSAIASVWTRRADRYSEARSAGARPAADTPDRKVEMSYIGG